MGGQVRWIAAGGSITAATIGQVKINRENCGPLTASAQGDDYITLDGHRDDLVEEGMDNVALLMQTKRMGITPEQLRRLRENVRLSTRPVLTVVLTCARGCSRIKSLWTLTTYMRG